MDALEPKATDKSPASDNVSDDLDDLALVMGQLTVVRKCRMCTTE
jgi:hypothetical protein